MRVSKNSEVAEFQKCGEIIMATKKTKFVMSCNFCQNTFTQLQAFMRHLQLQHNDKLQFVKEAKEVEVYAVEELINQTTSSCAPDIESEESYMAAEDAKWLSEDDMKWLKQGVEPGRKEQEDKMVNKSKGNTEDDDDLDFANMSILKALEDCDVSFNLIEKYAEEDDEKLNKDENYLENTLLREIQNDWADSDTNESITKKIDYTDTDMANYTKNLLEFNKKLDTDVNMTEIPINSTSIDDNLDTTKDSFETSPCKGIKILLQSLEDLDDVDSLLESLGGNLTTQKTSQEHVNIDVNLKQKINLKAEKNMFESRIKMKKTCKLNMENCSENSDVLFNNNVEIKTANDNINVKENLSRPNNFKQKSDVTGKASNFNDFETCLKQMELDLDVDISTNCNTVTQNSKSSKTTKTSQVKIHKQKHNFASKLKYLEDSLNDDTQQNKVSNTKINAIKDTEIVQDIADKFESIEDNCNLSIHTSFELHLKNLEESLNTAEMNDHVSTETLEDSSINSVNNADLNEDLTKALADALEDFDLLNKNILADEENEEPLNQDLLNILDQELLEKENGQELPILNEQQTLNVVMELKDNKTVSIFNKPGQSLITAKNNIKSKYQKTNLKAKTILSGKHTKNVLNSSKLLALKESNTINAEKIIKDSFSPLKGNHKIFLQQQQISGNYLLKSPAKTLVIENIDGKVYSFRQRKTPIKDNQENNTSPALNIRNIKKEKLTPVTNFINTDRGDKTPLKREEMFMKQSPKTQEKIESLKSNITPKRGDKTPQATKKKQSPITQEKLEKLNKQRTPPAPRQKTPQLPRQDVVKQSPKSQEKLNQTPQLIKTPQHMAPLHGKPKSQSPLKSATRSSEKQKAHPITSPTQATITNSNSNYNHAKTPLTTPQRLRNVTIKLQRFTPNKPTQKLAKPEQNSSEPAPQSKGNNSEPIIKQFKLPNGISFTKIIKQSFPQAPIQSEILETPVKPTYSQQNFSESSLEPIQQDDSQNKSLIDIHSTLIQPQFQTINNLITEASSSSHRQRKASIDIVPEKIQPNNQSSANKTPRHSNLDYKSYAVNRSARKRHVLQRMSHIKKQIFKSIEEGEYVTSVKRMKSPPRITQQKKSKVLIEHVQILPNLKKEIMTPLTNRSNMLRKPFANTVTRPNVNSVSPKNMADEQKQAKVSLQSSKNEPSIIDDEKLIKKSLKRPATSPLLNIDKQTKRQHRSPVKQPIKAVEKTSELEATQFDLSESVVNFLQTDLKTNRLNVDSFLNEDILIDDCSPADTSIKSNTKVAKIEESPKNNEISHSNNLINDLLEQVDSEQSAGEKDLKGNATDKDKKLNDSENHLDFDDIKDINLLANFGLKVIKLPKIEDVVSLEELDEMNEKATKFSNIYKYWQRIWSTKHVESSTAKEELEKCFKQLLADTNLAFKLDLSLIELKRLVNLIHFWYTNNFNSKLIEKQKISDSINRYLQMFHYIPKTIKRLYYCEYCEEYFNTEHKYFTHRIIHTGDLYPYTCKKCSVGFKIIRSLRTHESSCDFKISSFKMKPVDGTRSYKCLMCKDIFSTSELLYEHSKKHLKTIYKCAKCELVFALAIDVQNHMAVCNTNAKRIPKQYTPRPAKPKTESYSKN